MHCIENAFFLMCSVHSQVKTSIINLNTMLCQESLRGGFHNFPLPANVRKNMLADVNLNHSDTSVARS